MNINVSTLTMLHRAFVFILAAAVVAAPTIAPSAEKDERGLLPDIRLNAKTEEENEKRALQTELLITKAETKAIESLQNILKRKKGTDEESELLHRLAELYMRRARTGRFLDLHKDSKTLRLSTFPLPPEKGSDWIRKGSVTYSEIERRFPKYRELDSVLFNNAFAHQQLSKIKDAEKLYQRLIDKHPSSRLIPDAAVALGELAYDQRRFSLALHHLEIASRYPESRVYTYGLYKAAWAHYNMRDADRGIDRLLAVVKACPPDGGDSDVRNRQNLRREALRDLSLFVGDSRPAGELYSFFKKITTEEELGQSMMDVAKLYLSHSRYKEMNIFLDEFAKNHRNNIHLVKAGLNMVDANESLKRRKEVLDNLRAAGDLCRPDSSWRRAQTAEAVADSCAGAFQGKAREIAGKWWDIWQKNKAHREFSELTEQALRIVLDNEDPQHPDLNSRFAYAELLFQLGRFPEAAENYAIVGERNAEPTRRHDADYSALFSTEKALEKGKTALLEAKRKQYAQTYLNRHPKGTHAGAVTLRLAVIHYEERDLEGSAKWLTSLLAGQHGRDLQKKAEDLDLEILNVKKDYAKLATQAKSYRKLESASDRLATLKKVEIEASYAGMQERLKTAESVQASAELRSFAAAHPGTALAADALTQSAALDFMNGRGLDAADAVESLLKQSPKNAKINDGLQDAARAAALAGEMLRAADLLKKLASRDPKNRAAHLEAAADFLLMEDRAKEARGIYNLLLPTVPAGDRNRFYTKLLDTFGNDRNSGEVKKIESLVLSQNLEPFATKILTERAQQLFEAGQAAAAFEAARKIMSRDVPAEARAEARLIQARVLEDEFIRQSIKSSREDRLALVLAMKAEKLEKAQTAYLSASKMSPDASVQTAAFSGIDRCYAHFIDSFERLPAPPSLSEEEQKQFKGEIAKMLEPIREKRDESRKDVRKFAAAASDSRQRRWDDIGGEASPAPEAPLKWAFLKPYVPSRWSDEADQIRRFETRKPSCSSKNPEFASCFGAGQLDAAERVARELTQGKATRVQGWHHLALVAERRGLAAKAIWLLRQAEAEAPQHPLVNYEKGRMLSRLEGKTSASQDFAEVFDTALSSTEIGILKGLKAFSEGDFTGVKSHFSGFSTRELYDLNLGLLLSESFAQLGELDKAMKLISDLASFGRNPELLIQKGHLEEAFKFAPVPALEAYTEALKLAKDPAQKDWLVRKTEYLKVNFKVGLNVPTGD